MIFKSCFKWAWSLFRPKPYTIEITNFAKQLIDSNRYREPMMGHHKWNSVPWTCYFKKEIEDWCIEHCSAVPQITSMGYFTTHWDPRDEDVNVFRYHLHFATQKDLMKFHLTWL